MIDLIFLKTHSGYCNENGLKRHKMNAGSCCRNPGDKWHSFYSSGDGDREKWMSARNVFRK